MNNKLLANGIWLMAVFVAAYSVLGGCGRYYYPVDRKPEKPVEKPAEQPAKSRQQQGSVSQGVKRPAPHAPVVVRKGSYMEYPAMQQLIQRLSMKGFSRPYLVSVFSGVTRDDEILAKVASPAEAKPWRSYRPIFLTEERIRSGVGFWKRHYGALTAAEKRFGVEPEYIVAIIGVETLYGRNTGKHNVLRSLTTLAMDFPARSKFYISELEQFLQLAREEQLKNPAALKGSYAGAMGMGQFISSSYRNFAVDFNGDKHRDLWHPVDAIGSVANYFSRHGWRHGDDVAVVARITGGSYVKIAHTKATKPLYSLQQLAQYGVKPVQKIKSTRVDLLKLQGARSDEYWVTGDNFYTITRYNHSPKYAMAVFQLAHEIKRRMPAR